MKDLSQQISEQLLPRVRQPGQYLGLETNARCGDVRGAEVTVALAFPDAYTIGISHLGSQVLYHAVNDMPHAACDRVYCPLPDAEAVMRARSVPLFGWESRAAVGDFDILGFSLSYELCATNVLTMLHLAGIGLHAAERTDADPIVIAGDALADTPEPLADFIDLFLVGDGERPLADLVKLVRRMKAAGAGREEMILQAARTIPGAYAPRYYRPTREGTGDCPLLAVEPIRDDVPALVEHVHLPDLADSPPIARPLVPLVEGVHDRVVIEVMRGCPNACRFCQAGATRLPVRHRSVDEIVAAARAAVDATGCREISLLSLSTSDYPHLDELLARLTGEFSPRHVSISLPSLRVDSQLKHLPKLTGAVRKSGLTVAAEGGSERIRRAVGKRISEDDMIDGVRAAYQAGLKSVKVYFMAGLPTETDADVEAIHALCRRLSDVRREVDGRAGAISASVSWFVPKPHTPMQWCAMAEAEHFFDVRRRLIGLARRSPVRLKFHRIERSILEAVLCRGDRRVGAVIEAAWRNGARLDAWNEHWDWSKWTAAFEQTGIDPAAYAHRELPTGARLPWSHIACPRSESFLVSRYQRMMEALGESPQGSVRDE
ncbi:MAG: TIGR03960 family B12-binding radical SAM protein [Phycisphaerae bacterium]